MNIGYIYQLTAYPPRGGNHRHAYELVHAFHSLGHEVRVMEDPDMPNAVSYDGKQLSVFLTGIDVLYIRIDGRFTMASDLINRAMQHVAAPVVWEINAPANEALAFSWLGGKTSDRKETPIKRLRRRLHAMRQTPRIAKEEDHRRELARRVDAAVCVSSALARYAKEGLGINKVSIIPNGGPLLSKEEICTRRARRVSSQFTVLYSGSAIYPWQGLQYLSDTISRASVQATDVKFILAVNQRSSHLPTSPNAKIVEGLAREDILDLICQSDVCVALHPEYFWSRWRFHGSPMKLFEYMGCMTATLSSNLGQMKELIRHGEDGMLCENSAEDILAQINRLRADERLRDNIALNGWQRVRNELNWTANADKTISLFENVLGDKHQKDSNAYSTIRTSLGQPC